MTSDSSRKSRRDRCLGRKRTQAIALGCFCFCGIFVLYVIALRLSSNAKSFWSSGTMAKFAVAKGHVVEEALAAGTHKLVDVGLQWCHFVVQPTLFMLSAPGSVFMVFELASCDHGAADVKISFNMTERSGKKISIGHVLCSGKDTPVDYPTAGGPSPKSGPSEGQFRGNCERLDQGSERSVYRLRIEGLEVFKEYDYQVHVLGLKRHLLPVFKFHTHGPAHACGQKHGSSMGIANERGDVGENFHAFVISDVQSGAAVFRRAVEMMTKTMQQGNAVETPTKFGLGSTLGCGDLLVHVGDSVQNPSNMHEWHSYFLGPLEEGHLGQRLPMIFARGNHDVDGWNGDPQKHPVQIYTPGERWQSYTTGVYPGKHSTRSIFWVVLDSNHDSDASQLQFLREKLQSKACSQAAFRIIVVHIAPFIEYWDPKTWSQGEDKWGQDVRLKFAPLFEKYGVDLVISGHSHIYQRGSNAPTPLLKEDRSSSVTYVICGGGGAELESEYFNHVQNYGFYQVTSAQYHYLDIVMKGCEDSDKQIAGDSGILESNIHNHKMMRLPDGGSKKLRRRKDRKVANRDDIQPKIECRLQVTAINPVTENIVDQFILKKKDTR